MGILNAVRETSAYTKLRAEVKSLDQSKIGVNLGDLELTKLLESILARQGSCVEPLAAASTLFEDLATYCRAEYLSATASQRGASQRKKAQEEARARENEAAEGRRREAEAQRARQRQEAEARRREEEARWDRDRRAAQQQHTADAGSFGKSNGAYWQTGGTERGTAEYTRDFEDRAEARLYYKVAKRHVNTQGSVKGTEANGQFTVKLVVTAALKDSVDRAYRQALYDLQVAAATIRAEAARTRDEAVERAEAEYTLRCERAFQVAVEQYRA